MVGTTYKRENASKLDADLDRVLPSLQPSERPTSVKTHRNVTPTIPMNVRCGGRNDLQA